VEGARPTAFLRAPWRTPLSGEQFPLWLTSLFALTATASMLQHEMWRDEKQAWLLARDSTSLLDLFRHLKYEGHPGLWHVCLMALSRITPSPVIMQAFSVLIGATTVYVFARYSPFSRLQKLLFAFGYFSLYEYTIIARNYGIGVLLVCVFCVQFPRRYTHFAWIGTTVFLLCHTSVHALIIAIGILVALVADYVTHRAQILSTAGARARNIRTGFALMVAGVITSVWPLVPAADADYENGWFLRWDVARLREVIREVSHAFAPIPEPKLHFWGSHWPELLPGDHKVEAVLVLLLLGWWAVGIARKPTAFLMFVSATLGLIALFYTKFVGSIRHTGFVFVLFVAAAWIQQSCDDLDGFAAVHRAGKLWDRTSGPLLTCVLLLHLVGGVVVTGLDFRYVFSDGKAAAAFLTAHGLQDAPMVGERDYAATTVVGYLGRKSMYYPRGDRFGSFVIWDRARSADITVDHLMQSARRLGTDTGRDPILVLDRPLNDSVVAQNSLDVLASFTGSATAGEEFYLYLMHAAGHGR
jgi:hypothetical protein